LPLTALDEETRWIYSTNPQHHTGPTLARRNRIWIGCEWCRTGSWDHSANAVRWDDAASAAAIWLVWSQWDAQVQVFQQEHDGCGWSSSYVTSVIDTITHALDTWLTLRRTAAVRACLCALHGCVYTQRRRSVAASPARWSSMLRAHSHYSAVSGRVGGQASWRLYGCWSCWTVYVIYKGRAETWPLQLDELLPRWLCSVELWTLVVLLWSCFSYKQRLSHCVSCAAASNSPASAFQSLAAVGYYRRLLRMDALHNPACTHAAIDRRAGRSPPAFMSLRKPSSQCRRRTTRAAGGVGAL